MLRSVGLALMVAGALGQEVVDPQYAEPQYVAVGDWVTVGDSGNPWQNSRNDL